MSEYNEHSLKYSKVNRAYRWYLKYYALPHLAIIGMVVLPVPLGLIWDADFLPYIFLFGLLLVVVDGLDNCLLSMINWLYVRSYFPFALDMERRGQREEAVINLVDLMYIRPSWEAVLWEYLNNGR